MDDSSNLVELLPIDHAIAHKVLYHFWKREEDRLAWQVLNGNKTPEDARKEACSLVMKTKVGANSSQFGSRWYNNGFLEEKIRFGCDPPMGWIRGRLKKPPRQIGKIPWNKGNNSYITPEIRKSFGNGTRGKLNPKHGIWLKEKLKKDGHPMQGRKHRNDSKEKMSKTKLLKNKLRKIL